MQSQRVFLCITTLFLLDVFQSTNGQTTTSINSPSVSPTTSIVTQASFSPNSSCSSTNQSNASINSPSVTPTTSIVTQASCSPNSSCSVTNQSTATSSVTLTPLATITPSTSSDILPTTTSLTITTASVTPTSTSSAPTITSSNEIWDKFIMNYLGGTFISSIVLVAVAGLCLILLIALICTCHKYHKLKKKTNFPKDLIINNDSAWINSHDDLLMWERNLRASEVVPANGSSRPANEKRL